MTDKLHGTGAKAEELVAALALPPEYGDFNQKNFKGDALKGKAIDGQEYKSSGLMAAATRYVVEMLADADGKKIINALRNDKKLDLNGDGKVSDQEIGAMLVAASLDSQGKFDNHVSKADMDKLLDPNQRTAVVAIAKQLMTDSGVKAGGSAPIVVAASTQNNAPSR